LNAARTRAVCDILSRLHVGRLEFSGPHGERFCFAGRVAGPLAHVELRNSDAFVDFLRVNRGGARAFLDGGWDTDDLAAVLTLAELNYEVFTAPASSSWRRLMPASITRCKRANIHSRYRLGPDFYRHWLDSSMSYSAALFDDDASRDLEQAQVAKFDRILQGLRPQPGQTMLDIGCGWGGFAQHVAARYGCRVHGITLSSRQADWARQRIRAAGLEHLVTIQAGDFREVRGRYDFVVSIEAYEAMGQSAWGPYFDTIARCLHDGGKGLMQAAVVADVVFDRDRKYPNFIRQHIHPKARLAAWPMLEELARRARLRVRCSVLSSDDYIRTLQCWRERFNQAWPQLTGLGLEPEFRRLWNFYLAYCEARYRAGSTRLVQAHLEPAR
jgi:cyclopropane-fatty-acyl-phospholipid synthase